MEGVAPGSCIGFNSVARHDSTRPDDTVIVLRAWNGAGGIAMRGCKKQDFRDPEAVEYLLELTEEEAALHPPVVRKHADGFTHYWLENGEVRCRDVSLEELPKLKLGAGRQSPAMQALLAATEANFVRLIPRLVAELSGPEPDFESVERVIRDGSLEGGAALLKALLEELEGELPVPDCDSCGVRMVQQSWRGKRFTTLLDSLSVDRRYVYCRDCKSGHHLLDRAVGLEGDSFSPGAATLIVETVIDHSYQKSSERLAKLAGIRVPTTTLRRHALLLGKEVDEGELAPGLTGHQRHQDSSPGEECGEFP